ncbi:rhodanese-like domain-containing protein [Brachybacterium rhamnosum]|uniref:Rhodanese-like domain-containing protein n=1 Tax=Brachybacterium rhamnosum TaxID=173361 RepID=A0ABW4Q2Y0_9MICO
MSEITVAEVDVRRVRDQIVDVREDGEVAEGMIPGAIHMPLGQLASRAGELDRERPVVTVCRSGKRSARAAEELAAAGFQADTMGGGMIAWQNAGLPTS